MSAIARSSWPSSSTLPALFERSTIGTPDGTDVGGGASIMGTLSGGGTEVISVGRRCLLGANSGLGISVGDDCVIEAGLYVTAGTKVTLAVAGMHCGSCADKVTAAITGIDGFPEDDNVATVMLDHVMDEVG